MDFKVTVDGRHADVGVATQGELDPCVVAVGRQFGRDAVEEEHGLLSPRAVGHKIVQAGPDPGHAHVQLEGLHLLGQDPTVYACVGHERGG